jgi:Transposase DDE domain
MEKCFDLSKDFAYLLTFLPSEWEDKAKQLGALRRCRKVPNPKILLRILLIHLAEGCSLRETSVRVKEGGLADISDVAIMDRLRQSGEWFRWMNSELIKGWMGDNPQTVFGIDRCIRLIDGTRVCEPGPTGSSWCIHYSVELPSLTCNEIFIREKNVGGESFCHFTPNPGDLFVGDRVYGVRSSIFYVKENGGDVLVRFALKNLPLMTPSCHQFDLLKKLRTLKGRKLGDWPVNIDHEGKSLTGRVCALRKSKQAAEKSKIAVIRAAQKHGHKTRPETLEAAEYFFVFTTMDDEELSASQALEIYRNRWQIELVFKRLKSIMGLGHLRKSDPESAKSWLQGKLFVAFLIESLLRHTESFPP